MEDLYELLGSLIIVFYGLTVANFFLKFVLRHFRKQLQRFPRFFRFYTSLVKFFVRYHRYFGFATVLFIIGHFWSVSTTRGLSTTGFIAAGLMIFQVLLGIFGKYFHPKGKAWLWIHRVITIILAIAIAIHVE